MNESYICFCIECLTERKDKTEILTFSFGNIFFEKQRYAFLSGLQ